MKKIYRILLTILLFHIPCFGIKYNGSSQKILVYGAKTGWFGQIIVESLKNMGHKPIIAQSRLENRELVLKEIKQIAPNAIINAAGITGRPNIDWCDNHKPETIRANVLGCINLADIAHQLNIHMTYIGTGYLYNYDNAHPIGSGKGFTEQDAANHTSSFYCESKMYLQNMLACYPNVLVLRFGMPFSADCYPRNFIIKMTNYKKVINVPNSLSSLEDLLPIAIDMTLRKLTGVYNFTNPGAISHNEVLDLYKEIVDPNFKYQNFSVEEQHQILKAPRPNCILDTNKLTSEYPNIPDVRTSIIKALQSIKALRNTV